MACTIGESCLFSLHSLWVRMKNNYFDCYSFSLCKMFYSSITFYRSFHNHLLSFLSVVVVVVVVVVVIVIVTFILTFIVTVIILIITVVVVVFVIIHHNSFNLCLSHRRQSYLLLILIPFSSYHRFEDYLICY